MPSLEVDELENLLVHLKQSWQVDLTGYKRPSLLRRTLLRMQQVGVGHYQGYLQHLQQQPDEVTHLLNTIFINYTFFFRDPFMWNYLENQVIPQVIANKAPDEPIRLWSAGCASGEETYSLAMLLMEALSIKQFQRRVQIYGTDIDADAIQQAQNGCYPAFKAELIPPYFLERYFDFTSNGYRWRHELCNSVMFQIHNLIQAPPLPDIDLLICRNLLMYLTPETQLQVLTQFYSSLKQDGFLILGKVENLLTPLERSLFTPVHRQARVFTKVLNVLN